MGRYTTVQAYGDSNPTMRSVAYDQAVGDASAAAASTNKKQPLQTEKVSNPYGSTAGAGSGEFHIYRHARSREMQRLKQLDQDEVERLAEEEFQQQVRENQLLVESKTEKRRKKRQREKEAKQRKRVMQINGLKLNQDKNDHNSNDHDFEYKPKFASIVETENSQQLSQDSQVSVTQNEVSSGNEAKTSESPSPDSRVPAPSFKNDGSFIQTMLRLQQQN